MTEPAPTGAGGFGSPPGPGHDAATREIDLVDYLRRQFGYTLIAVPAGDDPSWWLERGVAGGPGPHPSGAVPEIVRVWREAAAGGQDAGVWWWRDEATGFTGTIADLDPATLAALTAGQPGEQEQPAVVEAAPTPDVKLPSASGGRRR